MKVVFFSTQPYDKSFFDRHNERFGFTLEYYETALNEKTVNLLGHTDAVCVFVNDQVNRNVLEQLSKKNINIVALRCAGFNNVDLHAAKALNITLVRVPAYSPYAVAEHTVAMIMTLNRKIHKAYNRVREQNFSLNGLLGFDLNGKTVGIIGTGTIGQVFSQIMTGFGCRVLAYDIHPDPKLSARGVQYASLQELFAQADIISLHCPLNDSTRYLINKETIALMKNGVMLINTSRGALIDTRAVIHALKSGKIGSLGIDVYEQEEHIFFHDLSDQIVKDDTIMRLSSFPNALITSHQGFFTHEALTQIASTTLINLKQLNEGKRCGNEITSQG
ncbi:MAG: 2-hydroxyacid dehydrogenase [Cyclobacteriaceae bacterium]|nr:2-hydroxyacid dehydrogenase [Cyclobacteriaceae bacterium]